MVGWTHLLDIPRMCSTRNVDAYALVANFHSLLGLANSPIGCNSWAGVLVLECVEGGGRVGFTLTDEGAVVTNDVREVKCQLYGLTKSTHASAKSGGAWRERDCLSILQPWAH